MSVFPYDANRAASLEDAPVTALYHDLLAAWNAQDAEAFAALFGETGLTIGFDGSLMQGAQEIATTLRTIFTDHPTAMYVAKVREVLFLSSTAAILRAVAEMVPRGGSDINPAVNVHQTLIATQSDGRWRITLFQNTPAQFHGRPDLAEAFTAELRVLLSESA